MSGQEKETSRLSRLIAILTQLQSKRLLTSTEVARKYKISARTVYRDIKALEEAGVPILSIEGKGYSLQEGYRLPPVSFTETEANALITAEGLVQVNTDTSLIKNYTEAITKIKSVLQRDAKDTAEILSKRIEIWQDPDNADPKSDWLSSIQLALTNFNVIKLEYRSSGTEVTSKRYVEPFALISKIGESWYLVAWCRLRKDYRLFRFDRIIRLDVTADTFTSHKMTLQEYLEQYRKNTFNTAT